MGGCSSLLAAQSAGFEGAELQAAVDGQVDWIRKDHAAKTITLSHLVKSSDVKGRRVGSVEYNVVSVLGTGAFGTVYKAQRASDDALFALKVVRTSPHKVMEESAQLLALRDPHLVRTHDCFMTDKEVVIVMDLCENGTLAQALDHVHASHRRLNESVVAAWLRDILAGLAYLHRHHIIHRDIKPSNRTAAPSIRLTY
jgi:serine/threonine protein kinase